jgi:hypothetical protein
MGTKPKIRIRVKCVDENLSGTYKVEIYCLSNGPNQLAFGQKGTQLSLSFTDGIATTTMTSSTAVSSDVRLTNYTMKWEGDIDSKNITQAIYTTHNAPKIAKNLFRKDTIDTTVGWATGGKKLDTSNDSTNTVRLVHLKVISAFDTYGYKEGTGIRNDPWTQIKANKGDCIAYADWMSKSMQLLGVTATNRTITGSSDWFFAQGQKPFWVTEEGDIDADGTLNKNEAGFIAGTVAGTRGTLEGIYEDQAPMFGWQSPGAVNMTYCLGVRDSQQAWWDANHPWNFHAASECVGHWWEITFKAKPDHDTKANMTKVGGPVIKARGPKDLNKF